MKKRKWYKQSSPNDNLCAAALNFLYHLGVPFFKDSVKHFLYSHKSYPRLSSVEAFLNNENIDALTVKISLEDFKRVDTPLIAYLSINKTFIVITEVTNNQVEYVSTTSGSNKENIEVFEKNWSGFVLMAETNSESGKNQRKLRTDSKLRQLFLVFFITFLFLSSWLKIYNENSINHFLYYSIFSINLIGVICSSSIIINKSREENMRFSNFFKTFLGGGYHPNLGCDRCSIKLKLFNLRFSDEDLISVLFFGNLIMLSYFPEMATSHVVVNFQRILLASFLFLFAIAFYKFLRFNRQLCIPKLITFLLVSIWFIIITKISPNKFNTVGWVYLFYYAAHLACCTILYFGIKIKFNYFLRLKEQNSEFSYFLKSKNILNNLLNKKVISIPEVSPFDLYIGNPLSSKTITLAIQPFNNLSLNYLNDARHFAGLNEEYKFQIFLYSDTVEAKAFTKTLIYNSLNYGNEKAMELLFQWYNKKSPVLSVWLKKNMLDQAFDDVNRLNKQIEIWNKFMEKELTSIPSVLFEGKLMPHYLSFKNFKSYFIRE